MALSQVQIIQSLAEALAWFEKELSWGVSPAELNHLTGRIGELYAAMITRGQMALTVNQHGYDVVSAENERISVKTITTSTHVRFNGTTFAEVDRILVLRLNVDEGEASIEEILDCDAQSATEFMRESARGWTYVPSANKQPTRPVEDLKVLRHAYADGLEIRQYENMTIHLEKGGERLSPAKPYLREIASAKGINLLNGQGNPKNTRQFGADIL